ncbi:MAG: SIS domain-containing protein [Phycisphaeraceae bacterium]|nr:SIS domain-containing protein [Phycisphaeraceae bacterium]MCW5762311.1 SIS domain-containing protein [Phycisphaeraceae bacterium]
MGQNATDRVKASLAAANDALAQFLSDQRAVDRIALVGAKIAAAMRSGGKVLACGNGGSCCDAMHFCEELTGRFRQDRRALPAIACSDPSHLTCVANDFGFEFVFSRWVEALGRPGDVLIALSTSGNSRNIVRAVESAGTIGMHRVALLGQGGGVLSGLCEHQWIVPARTSDRIQEIHMLILHCIVEAVEIELGVGS